jgi:hypothetical protein
MKLPATYKILKGIRHKKDKAMRDALIHTEVFAMPFVFVQKQSEIPYVLREGRRLIDPAIENFEEFSGSRLVRPFKVER